MVRQAKVEVNIWPQKQEVSLEELSWGIQALELYQLLSMVVIASCCVTGALDQVDGITKEDYHQILQLHIKATAGRSDVQTGQWSQKYIKTGFRWDKLGWH